MTDHLCSFGTNRLWDVEAPSDGRIRIGVVRPITIWAPKAALAPENARIIQQAMRLFAISSPPPLRMGFCELNLSPRMPYLISTAPRSGSTVALLSAVNPGGYLGACSLSASGLRHQDWPKR